MYFFNISVVPLHRGSVVVVAVIDGVDEVNVTTVVATDDEQGLLLLPQATGELYCHLVLKM